MLDQGIIDEVVERYTREYDRYQKLADFVYGRCQNIVDDAGVRATVQRRAKDPKSLRGKLERYLEKGKSEDLERFNSVDKVFEEISDLAAVRVTTYVESDREEIVEKLKKEFDVRKPELKAAGVGGIPEHSHYRAIHCQVLLKDDDLTDANSNLRGAHCEVQVCSMLAHVWNEIEHDLGYKPTTGKLSEGEYELLDALGHLARSGDTVIKNLLDATERRLKERTGTFQDLHDFIARMRDKFSKARRFSVNANQVYQELMALELNNPKKIEAELLDGEYEARGKSLLDKLADGIESHGGPPDAVLDEQSADLLMMLLFEKKAKEIVDAHPSGRGLGRPSRLVYLARRFLDLPSTEDPTAGEQKAQ